MIDVTFKGIVKAINEYKTELMAHCLLLIILAQIYFQITYENQVGKVYFWHLLDFDSYT